MKSLRTMSDRDLVALKVRIEVVLRRRDEKARRALVRSVEALRVGRGVARGRAAAQSHPLKGRKIKPKYRNPADRSQTWAGRGNQPRWLKAALKGGKKLSYFLIG